MQGTSPRSRSHAIEGPGDRGSGSPIAVPSGGFGRAALVGFRRSLSLCAGDAGQRHGSLSTGLAHVRTMLWVRLNRPQPCPVIRGGSRRSRRTSGGVRLPPPRCVHEDGPRELVSQRASSAAIDVSCARVDRVPFVVEVAARGALLVELCREGGRSVDHLLDVSADLGRNGGLSSAMEPSAR